MNNLSKILIQLAMTSALSKKRYHNYSIKSKHPRVAVQLGNIVKICPGGNGTKGKR